LKGKKRERRGGKAARLGRRPYKDRARSVRPRGKLRVFLASGFHGDLDVLGEGGEKVHETLDGKGTGAVAHQGGNVRLLDAEDLASFGLLEAAFSKEAINLERKLCLQEFLLGMGETRSAKNISTAFFDLIGFLFW